MSDLSSPVPAPPDEGSPNWASEKRKALEDRGFERVNDPRAVPAPEDIGETREVLNRLCEFIREHLHGGCRVMSQGWPDGDEGCRCPLCDVTRLSDEVSRLRSQVERMKAELPTPAEARLCLHVLETTGHGVSITHPLVAKLQQIGSRASDTGSQP